MKSPIVNFALSLVLLSTSVTLTSAIPAPLPAATGYASNTEEAKIAEQARAQLRPVWRPGPHLDESSAAAPTSLSARQGPVFRRNAESKFQYRKRTSAGLAVAGNLAYGLGERDVGSPFGINNVNHVPLPVAMRVRREASLMERDDDEEEDWDCSDYEDEDEDGEDQGDEEQWSAPASPAETPASSSSEPAKEQPQPSSSSAPAPVSISDSSNTNANTPNPLLTNNVIGTKKEDDSEAEPEVDSSSSASAEDSTSSSPSSEVSEPTSEAAWIAPAPEVTPSSTQVFVPEATRKVSLKKTHSKTTSKSKGKPEPIQPIQPLQPVLTTPSDIATGTLTVEQGCIRYHTVVSGEVCLGLLDWSKDLNLTLEQLYSYNPAIDSECMNLQIGWGVCIGANPTNATSTTTTGTSLLRKRNVQWRL